MRPGVYVRGALHEDPEVRDPGSSLFETVDVNSG